MLAHMTDVTEFVRQNFGLPVESRRLNFGALRPTVHHDAYVPQTKKLCPGSLDLPAIGFIKYGFCSECKVKVSLNKDGLAKRHYPKTGLSPNIRLTKS